MSLNTSITITNTLSSKQCLLCFYTLTLFLLLFCNDNKTNETCEDQPLLKPRGTWIVFLVCNWHHSFVIICLGLTFTNKHFLALRSSLTLLHLQFGHARTIVNQRQTRTYIIPTTNVQHKNTYKVITNDGKYIRCWIHILFRVITLKNNFSNWIFPALLKDTSYQGRSQNFFRRVVYLFLYEFLFIS